MKLPATLAAVLLLATLPSFADSINVFADQGHGATVQLTTTGNPTIHETWRQAGSFSLQLEFVAGSVFVSTLVADLSFNGQSPTEKILTLNCSSCTVTGVWVRQFSRPGVPGLLTVTVGGQTQTYRFFFQPAHVAPEPASLFLLGIGLIGVAWMKLRSAH